MTACVCSKCGALADSKNPAIRNVHEENQYEAMLSWLFKRELKNDEHGHPWLHIRVLATHDRWDEEKKAWVEAPMTDEERMVETFKWLHGVLNAMIDGKYPDDWLEKDKLSLKQWVCDHEWVKKNPSAKWEVGED
jgi:hypothetical protein